MEEEERGEEKGIGIKKGRMEVKRREGSSLLLEGSKDNLDDGLHIATHHQDCP